MCWHKTYYSMNIAYMHTHTIRLLPISKLRATCTCTGTCTCTCRGTCTWWRPWAGRAEWSPPSVDQTLEYWSLKQVASVAGRKWVWSLSCKLRPSLPQLLLLLLPCPLAVVTTMMMMMMVVAGGPWVGGHRLIIAGTGQLALWPCWRGGGDKSWQCGHCKPTGELQLIEAMFYYNVLWWRQIIIPFSLRQISLLTNSTQICSHPHRDTLSFPKIFEVYTQSTRVHLQKINLY